MLSGAERQARYKQKKLQRDREAEGAANENTTTSPLPAPSPSSSPRAWPPPHSPPVHETSPVTVTEARPFSAPPFVVALGDVSGDVSERDREPIIPPPPEPPPPPPNEDEAAMVAKLVRGYVELGLMMTLAKRPELVQAFAAPGTPGAKVLERLPTVLDFYERAAKACALKYNVRVPYQDEIVVAVGLGIASWGFAMEPSEAAKENARAAAARDANPANAPAPPGAGGLDV